MRADFSVFFASTNRHLLKYKENRLVVLESSCGSGSALILLSWVRDPYLECGSGSRNMEIDK